MLHPRTSGGRSHPPEHTLRGRGLPHYFFRYPADGRKYGNRSCKDFGFDTRGLGGQVVAPGSIHPKTGNAYTILSEEPPAPVPAWLLAECYSDDDTPHQTRSDGKLSGSFDGDIDRLPIKPETKNLIRYGAAKGQRSEPMMTVLNALVWANQTDAAIFDIFERYPIGEKFQEKGTSRNRWLQPQIDKARRHVADRAVISSHPGGQPSKSGATNFSLTDTGNAERFAAQHQGRVAFCHPWGRWLIFDGKRWLPDQKVRVQRLAKETVRKIYAEGRSRTGWRPPQISRPRGRPDRKQKRAARTW